MYGTVGSLLVVAGTFALSALALLLLWWIERITEN